MKKMYGFIFFFIVLPAVCHGSRFGTAITDGGKAKISFRVLDDEQRPVEKVQVQAGFYYDPEKQGIITGETDTNGLCAIEGMTCGDMWYSMEKSGYYKTKGQYLFGQVEPPVINNHWQPWNPTNMVVLKRIKNPVPMYVKSLNIGVPEFGKFLGFDIEKGDWVAPYGKGASSDLLFYPELTQRNPDDFDYTLTLTFPNKGDGIKAFEGSALNIGSQFKSDYEAPSGGYPSEWKQFRKRRPKEVETNNIDENRIYYFRVRTKLDEHGNIISARYGKIYGDFLSFTYYLNPTPNDRNVEFDPEKNLFGGRDRFAP